MDLPGITPRPVRLTNGEPETAEVFFDDVRVPADLMLGERGEGWHIAMTTVAYERGPGDVGVFPRYEAALRMLEVKACERGVLDDSVVRLGLARAYAKGEALRLTIIEQLSMRVAGRAPGSEGSIAKLLWIDAEQSLYQLGLEILGADAWLGREQAWLSEYLWSRAASIYGGTTQIQKNVLAQRELGMPRS
jgi:alkylation response protein AidB-like acyl-CoA dehydrogenase